MLKDAQHSVTDTLGTQGYPTTYVLDSNRNVVYKHEGEFEDGTAQAVTDAIDHILSPTTRTCPAPRH